MKNIKIISLFIVVALLFSFCGCRKTSDIDISSSSEQLVAEDETLYYVEICENGEEVVVDKDGNIVENATITEDGAIEIKDSETGDVVSTIPADKVQSFSGTANNEENKDETNTDSEESNVTASTDTSSNKTNTAASKPTTNTTTTNTTTPTTSNNNTSSVTSTPVEDTTTTTEELVPLTDAEIKEVEDYFFQLVNAERAKIGVQLLTRNSTLDKAAKIRVNETLTTWGHTRPNGDPARYVLTDVQYGTLSENIWSTDGINWTTDIIYEAGSYSEILTNAGSFIDKPDMKTVAQEMFDAYKNSIGHYTDIISTEFNYAGVGVTSYYENGQITCHNIMVFSEK